jgi:hypothetical protein
MKEGRDFRRGATCREPGRRGIPSERQKAVWARGTKVQQGVQGAGL